MNHLWAERHFSRGGRSLRISRGTGEVDFCEGTPVEQDIAQRCGAPIAPAAILAFDPGGHIPMPNDTEAGRRLADRQIASDTRRRMREVNERNFRARFPFVVVR